MSYACRYTCMTIIMRMYDCLEDNTNKSLFIQK